MSIEFLDIDFTIQTKIYTILIFFLLALCITLLCFIVVSRLIRRLIYKKYLRRKNEIREAINLLTINGLDSKAGDSRDSIRAFGKLRKYSLSSEYLSYFIIDYLVELNKSLRGQSSEILLEIYERLNLKALSLKKLKRRNWINIVRGIRELSEMNQKSSVGVITGFLSYRLKQVRLEARVATMKLSTENPLFFLDHMTDPMCEWQKVVIYNRLKQFDLNDVPSFSKYFTHLNLSVVSFCIDMTVQFSQYNALYELGKLLDHPHEDIKIMALKALEKLEAYQINTQVSNLLSLTTSIQVKCACLECLSEIGDPVTTIPLMKHSMGKHEHEDVVKVATKSYLELMRDEKDIDEYVFDDNTKAIISHYAHELIC